LVEAVEQFMRALELIATLPTTPALRRDEIKFQAALITPLNHVKGYSPEVKAAAERVLLLIEQAEARGETPEDPLMWFSALYGIIFSASQSLMAMCCVSLPNNSAPVPRSMERRSQ